MLFRQSLLALSFASLPLSWGLAVMKPREDGNHTADLFKRQLPPGPLFLKAPELDERFQPALDFDKDSCYNTPALGPPPDNDLNTGLEPIGDLGKLTEGCRREEMLERCNVYSRQRCNNGYCAIMYAYYFQKDETGVAGPAKGHRHDWEHVVVWVRMSDKFVSHVAVSAHTGYIIKPNHEVYWRPKEGKPESDGHPAVVYHKDGGSTHAFRFAGGADNGNGGPENHWRKWIFGPLIGHFGWDTVDQRTRMYTEGNSNGPWGDADLALTDSSFPGNLEKALPKHKETGPILAPNVPQEIYYVPDFKFDVNIDDPETNLIQ